MLQPNLSTFFKRNQHEIKEIQEVCEFIKWLPREQRLSFMMSTEAQDVVKNGRDILALLPFVPEDKQVEYITLHATKIQNGEELLALCRRLAIGVQTDFLLNYASKVQNERELCAITAMLPKSKRLDFVKPHKSLLQTREAFVEIAALLFDLDDKPQLQQTVSLVLDEHFDKKAAIKKNEIQNEKEILFLMKTVSEKKRLYFIKDQLAKFKDRESIKECLVLLPVEQHFDFLKRVVTV